MRRLLNAAVAIYLALLTVYVLVRGLFGDRFWWLSLFNTFAYVSLLPLVVLVPLAFLLRHQQALWRLTPVIVLGGLWFAPYYLRERSDLPPGRTLSVLSLNAWNDNQHLSAMEDWLRTTGADIAVLQEISPAYAAGSLPRLLDIYPYQASQPDNTRWTGNITLSRFPILSQEYVDLNLSDTTYPLRTVVDVDGQPVAVYNVHLVWPGGKVRVPLPGRLNNVYTQIFFGYDDRIRNQQIERLLAHLDTEPHPYIVAGDFNTSDQSATYHRMANHMVDSFREAGQGFGGSWPVSVARKLPWFVPPLIRIDYVWHSPDLRAVEAHIGPPVGSDHLPVQATLLLPDGLGVQIIQ